MTSHNSPILKSIAAYVYPSSNSYNDMNNNILYFLITNIAFCSLIKYYKYTLKSLAAAGRYILYDILLAASLSLKWFAVWQWKLAQYYQQNNIKQQETYHRFIWL